MNIRKILRENLEEIQINESNLIKEQLDPNTVEIINDLVFSALAGGGLGKLASVFDSETIELIKQVISGKNDDQDFSGGLSLAEGYDSPELMIGHMGNYMDFFSHLIEVIRDSNTFLAEIQDDVLFDELAPIVDELNDINQDLNNIINKRSKKYSDLADRLNKRYGPDSVSGEPTDIGDYNPN